MANQTSKSLARQPAAFALALTLGTVVAGAQSANAPSEQDKHFLENTAQDSNYEIKTGQLALKKSSSPDVKQYATMVIHDHELLRQQTKQADTVANVKPIGPDDLSIADRTKYTELDVLSGKTFDDTYIKGLLKGNEEGLNEAKSEASGSTFAPAKTLAEHRVILDSKHTRRAEALAQTHHIEASH